MATKRKTVAICGAARKVRMPTVIHPMLATLVDEPFSDPEWIFETKWDGFRSVCFIRNGQARFVSRNQIEMTPQYPELANVPKQLDAKQAILDGEIVVALIDHARATLKRLFRFGEEVELRPSNTQLQPMRVHASRVEIQGIFRGLMRPNA